MNELRPVTFTWNSRNGGLSGVEDIGFIAQDLSHAQKSANIQIPGLVINDGTETIYATYGKLLPVLVKSIQEMDAKINSLEEKLKQITK